MSDISDDDKELVGEPEADKSQLQSPTQFPIRIRDVVLYDLTITRSANRITDFQTTIAASNVEVAQPLILGSVMEITTGVTIRVPDSEDPAWILACKLNGVFDIDEDLDQDIIDRFAATTALPLVWPYMRELVQSLTVRMRVQPLVLPMIDLRNVPLVVYHETAPSTETSANDADTKAEAE